MVGQLVAFDIGECQVKMALFSGRKLKKAVAVELPDQLVSRGEILSMDAMADFLKAAAKENGIPRTGAAVILPSQQVFTRNVAVPLMTDAQLAYNLPFEFKDYLTLDKSRYFFDYSVLETVTDETGAPKELRLFACATLKSLIQDYRNMFRRAGFKLKFAMPEECAYGALIKDYVNQNQLPPADYCLVDIGHQGIRMHILKDGDPETKRTVELGMIDLATSISEQQGVDIHMAHTYMLTNYNGVLDDALSLELYNRMAVEIMKAVNFYNYNNREKTLERIYLCGGGVAVEEIRSAISRLTNLDVRPVAELMAGASKLDAPWLYAKAIGCGLEN